MSLSKYNITDATHSLLCSHQIGEHRKDYTMPCIVLGETKNGMVKCVVFGDRDWAGKDDVKKIRYVTPGKIVKNG